MRLRRRPGIVQHGFARSNANDGCMQGGGSRGPGTLMRTGCSDMPWQRSTSVHHRWARFLRVGSIVNAGPVHLRRRGPIAPGRSHSWLDLRCLGGPYDWLRKAPNYALSRRWGPDWRHWTIAAAVRALLCSLATLPAAMNVAPPKTLRSAVRLSLLTRLPPCSPFRTLPRRPG